MISCASSDGVVENQKQSSTPPAVNESMKQPTRKRHTSRTTTASTSTMTLRNMMVALVCLLLVGTSRAQRGNDCACTPSTYEFTFDFDLVCPRNGVDLPEGTSEVTCFVTSFSTEVDDLIPVMVQSISIIEADADRIPIAQSQVTGVFESGDTFTYSSVSALGNSTQIPQSIQLTITGINAANSSLVQVWAIKFTNECDVYPVLEEGGSFGWTEFTDLGTPRFEVCPAVGMPPTEAPTADDMEPVVGDAPTMEPTMEPTTETAEPTMKSTKGPKGTSEPTAAETDEPTIRPTLSPIIAPTTAEDLTMEPTMSPTKKPSKGKDKDTDKDTDAPTLLPTMEEDTEAPAMAPTLLPTAAPTKRPTLPDLDTPTTSILDTEAPSMTMSFSYDYVLQDEDYEMGDMEFGLGDISSDDESDKKNKKGKESDDKDPRERVRIGTRRHRRR